MSSLLTEENGKYIKEIETWLGVIVSSKMIKEQFESIKYRLEE